MEPFPDRLDHAVRSKRSPLCVGIDPRLDKIPAEVREKGGTPGETLRRFCLEVVDLVAPHAACVKPNIGFFEAYGLDGLAAYKAVLAAARAKGLLTIADVKRGDLGATAEAYADGHLRAGADFEADAVTLHGYMGGDSVEPWIKAAVAGGKGLFVLVRTSNPSAKDLQDVDCGGTAVYERVAGLVRSWGAAHRGASSLSLVGAVVGATWPEEAKRLRAALPETPFLVPGYGTQGATAKDVAAAFLPGGRGAVVNASRSITFPASKGSTDWRAAIEGAARAAKEELHAAVGA
jgi:orotidine-5'-phosphate decarboxylase